MRGLNSRLSPSVFRLRDLPDISAQSGRSAIIFYKNGEAHTLEELGSGLTQFLLTLASAAIKKPSYILIDEPELGLHPSLQIDFLTTLASYASEGVVYATHNVGLARATADRIYSVRQEPDGTSECRDFDDNPHLVELLGAMCFAGYRDLGCRTVLLVEGTTEVRTMQQFLRMWKKDHQVVILPLGGSSMIGPGRETELAEVTRIAERVVAVTDSERTRRDAPIPKDRRAFKRACDSVGIDCHILDRRATENYLSAKAVQLVKGEKYRALGPFESLKDASPAWAKSENWRIAREMSKAGLKGTDLYEIFESL